MSIKLFISYSHKDESYKDELIDHLGSLLQNNKISEWNDRKIVGSMDWENEIDDKLNDSDVVIFLISSSFISSNYCFGIEAQKALELHRSQKCRVLPVIIRPTADWQENEFAKLQVAPKDAKPVSTWDNFDSAWVDVVNKLKETINEFFPQDRIAKKADVFTTTVAKIDDGLDLTDFAKKWLEDTGLKFTHRKVDHVSLQDVYTPPDLKKDQENKDLEKNLPISSDIIFREEGYYLISGEEQSGKSTLLKNWCKELMAKDYLPVYFDAEDIKRSDLKHLLQKALKEMYQGLNVQHFLESENKVICIDNIDKIKLNEKYLSSFLAEITDVFNWVVITCDNTYKLLSKNHFSLSDYNSFTLFNFGNVKREEIIKKWVSLGQEETIQQDELYTRVDELKRELDIIVKNNIVPSKPIYILMILQVFEAHSKLDLDLTSHGYCYQQLIIQSFENAKVKPNEYEMYLNFLTELAWWIFENKIYPNDHQVTEFIKGYKKSFILKNEKKVIETMLNNRILENKNNRTLFKYPYIYYFFVGKKIAESFTSEAKTRHYLHDLLENLHREDYANILIFITHHTKEDWILNDIKEVLADVFKEEKRATLESEQLSFMRQFLESIPELVLEQREVSSSRRNLNTELDKNDAEENNLTSDELADEEILLLANINKTFKGMEIAGQIIRNRYASLKKDDLYSLVNTGVSSGLRLLNYCINSSKQVKDEIIRLISLQIAEHPNYSGEEIKTKAEDIYLRMTYQILNGVIRKISSSVGSKEADEIYKELADNENSPAYRLIKQSIDLQFNKVLNIDQVLETKKSFKNNPICSRILNEIVLNHIYMFPVKLETKQILADKLNISIRQQRNLEQIKESKG